MRDCVETSMLRQQFLSTPMQIKSGTSIWTMYVLKLSNEITEGIRHSIKLPELVCIPVPKWKECEPGFMFMLLWIFLLDV